MRCDKCKGDMKVKTVKMFGESVKAKVCSRCGYRLVNIDEAIKLQEKLLPKIHVEKRIIKLGDSSAITIPRQLKAFFAPGERVILDFKPSNMEIKIRKTE